MFIFAIIEGELKLASITCCHLSLTIYALYSLPAVVGALIGNVIRRLSRKSPTSTETFLFLLEVSSNPSYPAPTSQTRVLAEEIGKFDSDPIFPFLQARSSCKPQRGPELTTENYLEGQT